MQRIVLWELRNVKTGVVGATKCKELYCGSYEILCFYRRCSLSIGPLSMVRGYGGTQVAWGRRWFQEESEKPVKISS